MAAETKILAPGGEPQVTLRGGNLIRYRFRFYLWQPVGQTWPGTNSRMKRIHDVTLNMNHPPTDTFSLGPPAALKNLALSWIVDMKVPGGGGPLQYSAEVEIEQDGDAAMDPLWAENGQITNTETLADDTELKVSP